MSEKRHIDGDNDEATFYLLADAVQAGQPGDILTADLTVLDGVAVHLEVLLLYRGRVMVYANTATGGFLHGTEYDMADSEVRWTLAEAVADTVSAVFRRVLMGD